MPRSKSFTREDVLRKTVPLFWRKGYADTSLEDVELATGVNRSGLYSEFASKDDLFSAALKHYMDERGIVDALKQAPLGWSNVERFLKASEHHSRDASGCLMVFAIRELPILDTGAQKLVHQYNLKILELMVQNIRAERTTLDAERLAQMVLTIASGLALKQNHRKGREAKIATVSDYLNLLKRL